MCGTTQRNEVGRIIAAAIYLLLDIQYSMRIFSLMPESQVMRKQQMWPYHQYIISDIRYLLLQQLMCEINDMHFNSSQLLFYSDGLRGTTVIDVSFIY